MSVRISKVYTRSGDCGKTGLYKAGKVSKSHPRIQAGGSLDELNAFTAHAAVLISGSACGLTHKAKKQLYSMLRSVQNDLFTLNSVIACPGSIDPGISDGNIRYLEECINELAVNLPPLSGFVLPGGVMENTVLHICRTVCRRAERNIVKLDEEEKVPSGVIAYINRLSDLFFIMARYVSSENGIDEKMHE